MRLWRRPGASQGVQRTFCSGVMYDDQPKISFEPGTKMLRSFAFILVAMVPSICVVSAQPLNCGTPPQLPTQYQEEEKIKGELEGKAQFFLRLIGGGNLKGAVEAERHTI
jgi:hypothetical protein